MGGQPGEYRLRGVYAFAFGHHLTLIEGFFRGRRGAGPRTHVQLTWGVLSPPASLRIRCGSEGKDCGYVPSARDVLPLGGSVVSVWRVVSSVPLWGGEHTSPNPGGHTPPRAPALPSCISRPPLQGATPPSVVSMAGARALLCSYMASFFGPTMVHGLLVRVGARRSAFMELPWSKDLVLMRLNQV